MKKHLLKTMLVATGLLTSAVSTWADTKDLTPTAVTKIQSSNADNIFYDATATSWTCSQSKVSGGGVFSAQSGNNYPGPVILTKFDASTTLEGKKLTKATFKFTSVCNESGKNSNLQVAQIKTGWDETTATWNNTNKSDVLSAVNIDEVKNGVNVKKSTVVSLDVTKYLTATTDNNIGFAIYTFTAREQKVSNITLSLEYIDASSSANYTVKYVDAEGNELKASTTATGVSGEKATITKDEKSSIKTTDGTKYIYDSDDSESLTIAQDGSTVITLKFRKAETWNYTVNCIAGDYTKTITGTGTEGETFNVAYPYVLEVNGTLYTTSKQSNDKKGYYLDFNLSENNKTKDITYSATSTKNIVYLSEAEDIDGLTRTTNGNTAIRSSNGGSAYAKDGNVEITQLPAGVYKLHVCVCDATKNYMSVWNFLANEKNIFSFTATAVNWIEGDSEAFTINEETPIYLAQGGSNNAGVDFLYIQKVGDVATITSAEYATYVTTSAVKVPENVKVLTVKANTTGIETAELAAGTVIPAGTAVVLNAEAGDYTLEVADEAGTKPADNDLKPATADITADGTQYCLTQNEEGKVGFAKVQVGLNIPAGKAYLVVNNEAEANFFALDGSTTAIKNVEAAQTVDNAYYTLQGVKVERPTKGIYVKNGKKVVIK